LTQADLGFRTGANAGSVLAFGGPAASRAGLLEEEPQATLAALSDRLLNAPPERVAADLEEIIESLTRILGVDRCTLAEFTDEGRSLTWTHTFALPGIPPWPLDVSATLPWYTEQVRQGFTLVLPRLPDGLPPTAKAEAGFVAAVGLKSHLMVPLRAEGQVLGCLGGGSFRSFRTWSPELLSSLALVAGVLSSVLLRRQSGERLRAVEELNRSLQDEIRELRARLEADSTYLQKEILRAEGFDGIVGTSAALSKVLHQIEQVAAADSPVLVLGETGTGKDLVARAIHDRSRRKNRPLVPVNCAALPDALIESELFGYEKGAFTGAVARTLGRFEMADGGCILLDEIGELPLGVQAKLLRVLEGGTFERLGSSKTIRVDVRVLAATNRDLARDVREGRFRPDLYYRLNVFPLTVPPLRERSEDVPLLVWHFINARQSALGRSIKRVPERLMRALETHAWPGNVRELENLVERALIVSAGPNLEIDAPFAEATGGMTSSLTRLDDVQRAHIEAVLRQCGWKIAGKGNAADRLGLKRGTLQFRMRKLGIRRPEPAV
jgi:transcriptional regulator with GAF, ATPase, and Fis domain